MGRILVVDDEKSIRITLREFLINDGYEVYVAQDADEAMQIINHKELDVVLTDIILPRITGVDLLKNIRKISPNIQVIMMTGEPTVETASESLRSGAFDYLYKPISKNDVLKTIKNALNVKFLNDEKQRLEAENKKHQEKLEHLVQKRTKSLKESEKRYRQLVHYSPDGIAIYAAGKIIFANESMKNILAKIPDSLFEEMIGKLSEQKLDASHYFDLKENNGMKMTTHDQIFIGTDSSKIHLDIIALFIRLQDKPAIQIIVRDITRQKQLEMSLRQAHKMEAIGTLAGGIAHDFNNILSSVIGFTELAMEDVQKDTLVYNNLQAVLKAGIRARDLVKQILTFSRQVDQELKPLMPKLIIKEALKLLRASLPSTIEIKQNIQSNSLIMADPIHIHQILMNLCTNAGQAMQQNGGILFVELVDKIIEERFPKQFQDVKPGHYINLIVSDTGEGIAPELLSRIFDPFFTTKEQGQGTGLGLAVVHGIVKSCGGNIHVYSEPKKGSTFKVFLPVIKKRANTDNAVKPEIPKGTESILFIDDEPVIANMGKQILKSLGYNVITKTSSIDALELFKNQPDHFDLVITDMTMPQMTGEALAVDIIAIRPDIPVIICTGFSMHMNPEKADMLGIKAFIPKPILKHEIAEIVRRVLDE